jgi:hypothetical protein
MAFSGLAMLALTGVTGCAQGSAETPNNVITQPAGQCQGASCEPTATAVHTPSSIVSSNLTPTPSASPTRSRHHRH